MTLEWRSRPTPTELERETEDADAEEGVCASSALPAECAAVMTDHVDSMLANDRYVVDLDHTGIPDGNLYAVNLERGDRTGDNFIFLGRKGEDGDQTVKFTFPRDLVEVGDGWTVKARYITPDGTKSARIDCGAPF